MTTDRSSSCLRVNHRIWMPGHDVHRRSIRVDHEDAARRARVSAKGRYCSWSCSMGLFHLIYELSYRCHLRPPAPSAARLVQIMVPTWGGPCRAFIGQPSLKARRRRVLS